MPAVPAALAGAFVLWAGVAAAETQLLAGKRLALRQSPKSERLVVVSRDQLVAPLPGGSDDPTLLGAALEIGNPRTGEWVRFTIPAAGWTLNALGTVFRYEGGRPRAVGSVRELVIRHGKRLKVSAPAAGLSLDEPTQGSLAVLLTTGSRRYCMLFGGASVKRDEPRRFAARNAPAPASCPVPPAVTSTTSTSLPQAASTTTSSTRAAQLPSSTSTSSSTTVTISSTSSTSSTRAPTPSTTTSRPPTTTTSTSTTISSTTSTSSSTSSSATSTSTSSTTTSTGYTCAGFALFCGGTCPPGATCVGGLITPCRCEVLDDD